MSESTILSIMEGQAELCRLGGVDPEPFYRLWIELRENSALSDAMEEVIQERALTRIRGNQRT
jgi:hypothetical protein